ARRANTPFVPLIGRYEDNGDGTVTDYDTGLQWEQKTDDSGIHDKDIALAWSSQPFPGGTFPDGPAFTVFLFVLNFATSGDGTTISGCFAGHCDWRLPANGELAGIVDTAAPGCTTCPPDEAGLCSDPPSTGPCIDQVFGPTAVDRPYWTATTLDDPTYLAY